MGNVELSVVTRSKLIEDLRRLGVLPGQVVMIHVSVKAIGQVIGGPDVVIQALLDVLTSDGTLTMYISWEEWERHLVSFTDWPQDVQQAYMAECPPFDSNSSRAMRQWSILTEFLRTWPGAYRSDHPTASVVAVGARAKWLTENHPLQYGYGAGSPLAKLCEARGKLLLLGSPLDRVTLMHYAEHLAKVPHKCIVRHKVPLLRDGKRKWVEFEEFNTCDGIRDRDPGEYFETITREYLSSGKGHSGKVGNARSYLLDAAELAAFAIQWMEDLWGKD